MYFDEQFFKKENFSNNIATHKEQYREKFYTLKKLFFVLTKGTTLLSFLYFDSKLLSDLRVGQMVGPDDFQIEFFECQQFPGQVGTRLFR